MDPLTQGTLGAVLPQATQHKIDKRLGLAALVGFAGGMAPDLDVIIRSDVDPLLYLEYHRQFTHSLIFIPIGGLIMAALFQVVIGRRMGLPFKLVWLFATLGFVTHGFLDTATSYGTQLFWPFSNERFSWSIISIIDPLFTVPLLLCVILGAWRKRVLYPRIGLAWAVLYLGLGTWQHWTALQIGHEIAEERGHTPLRLEAKPSFGNIIVWKVVYETEGRYYVDAVRTGPGAKMVFPGESVAKLDIKRDFPWLDPTMQQAKDIERFRWFSQGFVAQDPERPLRVIDVRYSLLPHEIKSLWSIRLDPEADADWHARFETHRRRGPNDKDILWAMIKGDDLPQQAAVDPPKSTPTFE